MNIKNLKPNKKSRYSQGYLDPRSCKKYIDSSHPIIYRSSYEKKFIIWCENNPNVERWGSEVIQIPYKIKGSNHTYNPDFYVEMSNGEKWLVEIKPKNQTTKPINENSWLMNEWIKNNYKWRAAMIFCESKGIKFKILTEDTIRLL